MGNQITVYRAPRLKLVNEKDLKTGSYYLDMSNGGIYRKTMNGDFNIGLQDSDWDPSPYKEFDAHVFESAEAMCKWVAGGRKLEDLQGDSKSEWIPAHELKSGQFSTIAEPFGCLTTGTPMLMTSSENYPLVHLETGGTWSVKSVGVINIPIMVWPIRFDLGDTITITQE